MSIKVLRLRGNIAAYARDRSSLRIYTHPSIDFGAWIDVGDLVRVVDRDSDDGGWWRGRVVYHYRCALAELPRRYLMQDVPGYRTRDELLRTLLRMGGDVDVWDVIDVYGIKREDYDLSELARMASGHAGESGGEE